MKIVTDALPCGCIPGRYLCPQAELLWADVGWWHWQERTLRLEGKIKEAETMLREYQAAMTAYRVHTGETP